MIDPEIHTVGTDTKVAINLRPGVPEPWWLVYAKAATIAMLIGVTLFLLAQCSLLPIKPKCEFQGEYSIRVCR